MLIDLDSIKLNKPIILAPIDGYTDIPFRLIVKDMNPDLMYTEFIHSDAIIHDNRITKQKMQILDIERPVAIQIFGKDVNNIVKAAQMIAELNPEVIDLNFGCPSPTVAGHGSGAALLNNLPLMKSICEKVVAAVDIPVTIKTRIGWDFDNIVIFDAYNAVKDSGIRAITLHPRTKSQKFKGKSDWKYIKELKEISKLPIIGNGDINSPEDAKIMFDSTGCDGIMIARAAIDNPWIFKQIKDFLKTGKYAKDISLKERIRVCLKHYDLSLEYKGEKRGMFEMRKLYQKYFRGLRNLKRFKKVIFASADPVGIRDMIINIEDICEDKKIDSYDLKPINHRDLY